MEDYPNVRRESGVASRLSRARSRQAGSRRKRARGEEREADDRDRNERDGVGDQGHARSPVERDAEDVGQRELNGGVVTADASRGGNGQAEDGGGRDDVGGRQRKRRGRTRA